MENKEIIASYKGLKPTENNTPKFKRIEEAINKEGFGYEIVKENGRIIGIKFNNFYPTKDEIEIFEPPVDNELGTYIVGVDLYGKPPLKEAIEVLCNALRENEELYNKIVLDFENTTIKYIKDNHVNWMDIEVCDNEKFKNILNIFTKSFLNLLINK